MARNGSELAIVLRFLEAAAELTEHHAAALAARVDAERVRPSLARAGLWA